MGFNTTASGLRPWRKEIVFPGSFFLLLVLLAYAPALNNPFMLDDHVVLFGQTGVAHMGLAEVFTGYQNIFYRPVGHLFMMGCYQLFGSHPAPYHAANGILLAGIVFLFYRIVLRLTGHRELAFLSAVLYAVHPMNSMLVNYITASVISTFVLTLQVSFLFFLRYIDGGGKRYYALSLGSFVLALLSHEMSLIYPAYIFCLLYFVQRTGVLRAFKLSLPFLALAAGYFVLRLYIFSLSGMVAAVGAVMPVFPIYISSVMELIYWYISRLFIPVDIVFLWTKVLDGHFFPGEILRLAGLLLIVFYVALMRWKRGARPFLLAVFVLGFLPCFWATYAHFPFCDPMIEPHWFYFSSIGFFVLAAALLVKVKDRWGAVRAWPVWGAAVLALLLFLQLNNTHWRDQETYCRYWLALNKGNATPYHGLGQALLEKGDSAQALPYLHQSLKVARFDNEMMIADLGYAYFLQGNDSQALQYYTRALAVDAHYHRTHYYLGLWYLRAGDLEQARVSFLSAIKAYGFDADYYKHLLMTENELSRRKEL